MLSRLRVELCDAAGDEVELVGLLEISLRIDESPMIVAGQPRGCRLACPCGA
jgi:hypothetical protein